MSWRIFIAAALCVAIALLLAGAPPAAVLIGIALVALLNYRNRLKSGTTSRTVNP
jgi:hypothetical protein